MASLDGISFFNDSITYPKYPVYDLILCAKFSDIYGFFSLRELVDKKTDIRDTGFVYNFTTNLNFSEKNMKKLFSSNDSLGIDNKKIINKKRNIPELFKLSYSQKLLEEIQRKQMKFVKKNEIENKIKNAFKFNSGSKLMFHLQKTEKNGLNLLTTDTMKVINSNSTKDKVFIFRSIVYNKDNNISDDLECVEKSIRVKGEKCKSTRGQNISKDIMKYKFCKQRNFIHPSDLDGLYRFTGRDQEQFQFCYLRQQDLPRLSSSLLLINIFKHVGVKEIDSGDMCFDIEKLETENKKILSEGIEEKVEVFKKDKRKKEELTKARYGLFQNIVLRNNKITDINSKVFENYLNPRNKKCIAKNFRREDEILGKFENGIYEVLCPSDLEEVRIREVNFFQDSIKSDLVSSFSETAKNNLVNWYKKNKLYPRPGGNYLVIRDSLIQPEFLIGQELDIRVFIRAFQNTLSRSNVKSEKFGYLLLQSFVYWVQITYEDLYSVKGSQFRSQFKEISEYLLKGRSTGYDYEYINDMLTEITGKSDPSENILDFLNVERLQVSSIAQLQPLRNVSAFVLCGIKDNCDKISKKDDIYRVRFISDDVYISLKDDKQEPVFENNYIKKYTNISSTEDISNPFRVSGEVFKLRFREDKRK